MNFVTCCSLQNVVIVTITIKVYTADIIPTAFWIIIDNIGRFLFSPRKIRKRCLLLTSCPSVCSLEWGPFLLNWFWRNFML